MLREGLPNAGSADPAAETHWFGNYELLRRIGHGGMGVVYLARQARLDRIVAVKLMARGAFSSRESVQRFQAEASAAASLQHPNIVAIHDVGEHEGQPYYSMEFVEGRTLGELVREHPLPARQAAGYLKTIATAIHHAHERGILHRDLKPSNILVDPFDQPRITDFGLAKRLALDSGMTLAGEVLGSPCFMPPEQAEGRGKTLGPAADVYGLGALLYHLLTRQPPFQAETLTSLLKQVIESEPVSPRLLNPSIPRDLETICLKCLQKEPHRRYQTARDLAEELQRFLDDHPIRARPASLVEKGWRWCRRQPVRAGLAGALILALGLGSAGVLWQWETARDNARAEADQRWVAQHATYAATIRLIQSLIEDEQFASARQMLLEAPEAFRGWEWGWLQRSCNEDLMTLTASNELVFAAFSPDGRELVGAGLGPTLHRWEVATGKELDPWDGNFTTFGYSSYSRDGRKFAGACWSDRTARIWDTRTGRITATLTNRVGVFLADFSPDGRWVVTAGMDGKVQVWDAESGAFTGKEATYGDQVYAAAFSPDARKIAFGGGHYLWANSLDRSVRVWDLASGVVRVLGSHSELVGGLSWSPDGTTLASCSWSGEIRLWDAASGSELPALPKPTVRGCVLRICFSPDGRYLAAAGAKFPNVTASVDLFDVPGRKLVRQYRGHSKSVCDVRFSADGQLLATASVDASVKVWPVEPAPAFTTLEGHDQAVWTVGYTQDGRRLVTGGFDNTARIWDAGSGRLLRTIGVGCPVISVALRPDGRRLLTPGTNNMALVWDLESGQLQTRLAGHQAPVTSVAWADNNRWVATGSRDRCVRIWDPATGVCLATLTGHTGWLRTLCFSPQTDFLATGGDDRAVRVWDTSTWECRRTYTRHAQPVLCLAFSPKIPTVLASGSADHSVRIWDVGTGHDVAPALNGHIQPVTSLAFSPDGRRLATTANATNLWANLDRDSMVRLWDVESGHPVLRLLVHENAVYCVTFSPDGRHLASGGGDNIVRIREAFPWVEADYPGDPRHLLDARLERFKRGFKRQDGIAAAGGVSRPGRRVFQHIMGELYLPAPGSKTRPLLPVPERSSLSTSDQIDLSGIHNVALNETWQPINSADESHINLAALPSGLQTLAGVPFEIRGLIQLRRAAADWELFPDRVAIPVGQRFRNFHVLHGARGQADEGQLVGSFVVHYLDGSRAELPIRYGHHVRQEDDTDEQVTSCLQARTAWTSPVILSGRTRQSRLYVATFSNPKPDLLVERVEYESAMTRCAPFLVAMTVE